MEIIAICVIVLLSFLLLVVGHGLSTGNNGITGAGLVVLILVLIIALTVSLAVR